jgi:hypothetical protein
VLLAEVLTVGVTKAKNLHGGCRSLTSEWQGGGMMQQPIKARRPLPLPLA